jgi:hypothetical protein
VQALSHLPPGDQPNLGESGGADFSIFCQVTIALEIDHSRFGIRPEDAVNLAGIKAEGVEAGLELGDVLTPEHGPAEVEEAVTEAIAGFIKGSPSLGADDAIGIEVLGGLEGNDGCPGGFTEESARVFVRREAEGGESILDVADFGTLASHGVEPHQPNLSPAAEGGVN